MPFTSTKDTEYGDCYFDVSKTDKRLIRATLKNMEKTGTYVFLKLFKKGQKNTGLIKDFFCFWTNLGAQWKPKTKFLIQKSCPRKFQQNHHQQKNRSSNKQLPAKMVEAMFKRSPGYFKQFQKQFKFIILEEKPNDITSFTNYAVCPHFDSEFCQLATNQFYILLDSTSEFNEAMKQIKTYAVLCLFTTFKHLFPTSTKLETNGDIFSKLKLAIEYNNHSTQTVTVSKQLPIFPSTAAAAKNSLTKAKNLVNFKNWWTGNNPQCHLAFSRQRDTYWKSL